MKNNLWFLENSIIHFTEFSNFEIENHNYSLSFLIWKLYHFYGSGQILKLFLIGNKINQTWEDSGD